MKNRVSTLLASGVALAMMSIGPAVAQSTPTTGLFGKFYESYTASTGCNFPGQSCRKSFPQNTTGERILVKQVSCTVLTGDLPVKLVHFGISLAAEGTFAKRTVMEIVNAHVNGNNHTATVIAHPNIILGPGRFPTVEATMDNFSGALFECNLNGEVIQAN